jgi:hypothetical protein
VEEAADRQAEAVAVRPEVARVAAVTLELALVVAADRATRRGGPVGMADLRPRVAPAASRRQVRGALILAGQVGLAGASSRARTTRTG